MAITLKNRLLGVCVRLGWWERDGYYALRRSPADEFNPPRSLIASQGEAIYRSKLGGEFAFTGTVALQGNPVETYFK